MKYAVEMGSDVMIYVHTKFHKDWFGNSKVDRRDCTDAKIHRQHSDLISLLLFFQNKESRLKIN
jgi:hypothetical protein